MLRIGRVHRQALLTSGATLEQARLEGVIPFQARVHLPWERLPSRTPVCGGSDSLHTGAVPKTEHNEGADPKTELKILNTALLLVCWSVSLLFRRVSFLVGLASRSSFVHVCHRFPLCFCPEEGRRPQNRSLSAGTPLPSSTVVCYGSWVTQY